MKSLDFNMDKLLVWIKLGNVPLELFTQRGLSYIASAIGVPLYMDQITAKKQRLSFAKICIELESTKEIPCAIDVKLRDGSLVLVFVEIPWRPLKCVNCNIFGHSNKDCPRKTKVTKAWVPKQLEEQRINKAEKEDQVVKKLDKPVVTPEMKENNVASSSVGRKVGSVNRFAVLDTISDNEEMNKEDCDPCSIPRSEMHEQVDEVCIPSRKPKVAAAGVAELMRTLKPKKKGPINKGKKQFKVGYPTLGNQVSTSFS